MISRGQPKASRLERRRISVLVACDSFAKGSGERKTHRRSTLTSRRELNSACHGLALTLLFIRPPQINAVC